MVHCGLAKNSPPEADTRLGFHQLGVGSVSKRGGEQLAFNMAKNYEDQCFSWLCLGHGVAYDGFRTHRLLAAEEGICSHFRLSPCERPSPSGRGLLASLSREEVIRDRHETSSLRISSLNPLPHYIRGSSS